MNFFNKKDDESSTTGNDQARNILGDENKESAAAAITGELDLVDPDSKPIKQKRGRKPKDATPVEGQILPPSPAQMLLGESVVETQAIALTTVVAMFSTSESAAKIYQLHVETHKKKLASAFAMCAKEFGVEVTGKMAALSMLATAEVGLLRECWDAWTPKEEKSEERN